MNDPETAYSMSVQYAQSPANHGPASGFFSQTPALVSNPRDPLVYTSIMLIIFEYSLIVLGFIIWRFTLVSQSGSLRKSISITCTC